jgi:sucrose-6-phosphate hydrolase SacC (GH32 family)
MHSVAKLSPLIALAALSCAKEYDIVAKAPEVDPGEVTPCGFTPIPGTQLSEYNCNPVFDGAGEEWGSNVGSVGFNTIEVLGHPFYQIWYTATPDADGAGWWGLGYAMSDEGTEWEVHADNPVMEAASSTWDSDGWSGMDVVWDPTGSQYIVTYQGLEYDAFGGLANLGFGVATSEDGVSWTPHPDNPVIDFLETDGYPAICWPLTVAANEGGGFTGYLAAQASAEDDACQVYPAQSDDLSTWTLLDRPVIAGGTDSYDQMGVVSADIVSLDGKDYLFYVGFAAWEDHGTYRTASQLTLSLATSDNGISWKKHGDNPLLVGGTELGQVSAVAAQVVGERIHLWVTDFYPELDRSAVGYFLFEPGVPVHE